MTDQSAAPSQAPATILCALGTWWKSLAARSQGSDGLQGLSHDDVELIARDVGLSSRDLYDLAAKGGHAADQAPELMRALGLDPATADAAQHATYADILLTCSRCGAKHRCSHDLKTGTAEQHFAEYCPNADTLAALRAIAAAQPAG